MPTYQYECKDCTNHFEQFQKFSDDPLTVCPTCEGSVRRVIQNVGIVFKGSGWYINDSRTSAKEKSPADSAASDKPGSETTSATSEKSTKADSGGAKATAAAT